MPRDLTQWTDEMVAIAAGMKRAGLSNKAIAERLGISVRAVAGRMSRAGAKRRLDGRTGLRGAGAQRLYLDRAQHIYDDKEDYDQ